MPQHLGLPLAKRIQDRRCPPNKDPAVPIVFSRREVFLGGRAVRLFLKLLHMISRRGRARFLPSRDRWLRRSLALPKLLAAMDIPKYFRRIGGTDSECDDPLRQRLDHRDGLTNC